MTHNKLYLPLIEYVQVFLHLCFEQKYRILYFQSSHLKPEEKTNFGDF